MAHLASEQVIVGLGDSFRGSKGEETSNCNTKAIYTNTKVPTDPAKPNFGNTCFLDSKIGLLIYNIFKGVVTFLELNANSIVLL